MWSRSGSRERRALRALVPVCAACAVAAPPAAERSELCEEPPVGGAEGRVAPMDRRERSTLVAPRRPRPPPARITTSFRLWRSSPGQVVGEVPPAEARAEHRVLRVEVGDAPRARREHALVGEPSLVPLREDDLDVKSASVSRRNGARVRRASAWRGADDGDHADRRRAASRSSPDARLGTAGRRPAWPFPRARAQRRPTAPAYRS